MTLPILISGFTLGAAGSMHCIGMCGPISLMLPIHNLSHFKKIISLLIYQFGRITTYSTIGLLFGLAGRKIYISGYQQTFSITIGILTILIALLLLTGKQHIRFTFLNRFYLLVQSTVATILKKANKPQSFFLLGVANGFLPCGMVYIASLSALSFATVSQSIAFMAMFGAGTLPAMMLIGYAGQKINTRWRVSIRTLAPILITLMGVILVLRGLNLNIPFISPEFPDAPGKLVKCHSN